MIVLPLNEEARSGRRPPWVTLVLVATCLLVFLYHRGTDAEVDEASEVAIESAWEYFAEHPYVKVDADAAALLGEDEVADLAQRFAGQLRASGSMGIPDFVRQHDQVEFDARLEAAYEAMAGHSFYRFGFFPETLSAPDTTLLTYVLVHEGWLHLVSNLVIVLLAGMFLEEVWGRVVYLAFVLTGIVAGALGYALLDRDAVEALGGASGLGAALAGAWLVRFALVPVRFQYFVIPPFGGKFTARGWVALPIYGVLYVLADAFLTKAVIGPEPVVSEFATWSHVGGLAWGAVFAITMKASRLEERFIHPKLEKKMTARSNPLLDRALEAREAGRTEEAFEILASEVIRHPDDRDAALAFWDAASAVQRPAEAVEALARVLRDEVSSDESDLALQHWRELTQRVPEFQLEAPVEVKIAGWLIENREHDLASFSVTRVLDGRCGSVSGTTAHRLALVARRLDLDMALRAAQTAAASHDLDPGEADEVARLIDDLEAESARKSRELSMTVDDVNEQSGSPMFDGGYDFGDRSAAVAEAAEEDGDDDALDSDGDTLNAEPFELDDLTPPPGVQTFDLEGAADASPTTPPASGEASAPGIQNFDLESAGDSSSARLAEGRTTPPGASTLPGVTELDLDAAPPSLDEGPSLDDAPPSLDELPSLDAAPPSLDELPSLDAAPPSLDEGPSLEATRALPADSSMPGLLGDPSDDLDLGADDLELADEGPGPVELDASSGGLAHHAGELAHDDGDFDLADDDELGLDDSLSGASSPGGAASGEDDYGRTIDMSALGARTIPGYASDDAAASPSLESSGGVDYGQTGGVDYGQTVDIASLGARTLPPHHGAEDALASGLGADDLGPDLDVDGPDLDVDAPDLDVDGPDLDVDGPDLEVDGPDLDMGAPDLEVEAPGLEAQAPAPQPTVAARAMPAPAVPSAAPAAPEPAPRPASPARSLRMLEAVPVALGAEALTLTTEGRGEAMLALERIDGVAAAGVRGLRDKPVVVVDLITNWRGDPGQPLKVVRLRSDRFDPCKLVEGETHGIRALKRWLATLIEQTGATPLPDAAAAVGSPFRTFDGVAAYEREVLGVG